MNRRRITSLVTVAVLLPNVTGCYESMAIRTAVVPAGTDVSFAITDRGRVGFGVRGEGLVGGVCRVAIGHWSGEEINVSRDYIASAKERRLSRKRSWLAAGIVVGALAGRARGNADRLAVMDDDATLPAPGTSIAVRTIHAAVGTGAVDVYVANSGVADPIAAKVGQFANVAYLAKTTYSTLPVRSGTEALYLFGVANAGATTTLFFATPNQPGIPTPAGQLTSPQPGVQIAGSVLTAVMFPGATAGSPAATATNQTPTVILFIDKAL